MFRTWDNTFRFRDQAFVTVQACGLLLDKILLVSFISSKATDVQYQPLEKSVIFCFETFTYSTIITNFSLHLRAVLSEGNKLFSAACHLSLLLLHVTSQSSIVIES